MNAPYRVTAEESVDERYSRYVAAWASLRNRRRYRWIAFPAFPVLTLVTRGVLGAVAGQEFAEAHILVVAGVFMALAFVVSLSPYWFSCPRCGERFEQVRMRNSFRVVHEDRCQHCKLEMGELPSKT